jgi:DNA polymerase-3 subunit beta
MKLVIERAELLGALTLADKVVARRNTIAILSHVLLSTTKGGIAVTGTDMDRFVTVEAPAGTVARKGTTTVNAASLMNFVRATPDGGQVELEHDEKAGRVVLRAGRARATLPTLPPADFPVAPAEDFAHQVDVDGKTLAAAIKRVAHCMSNEETRYYLNGAYLHSQDGALRLVATNGHTLAWARLPVESTVPEAWPGIIVPRQAVHDLAGLAADAGTPLTLQANEHRLKVSLERTVYVTRLVDGTFPDYERVIPKQSDSGFSTRRDGLESALARCAAVIAGNAKEKGSKAVRLTVDKRTLQLSVRDAERGDVEDEVDAALTGQPSETGFNSVYMAAALGALEGDTVDAEFSPGAPIVLRDAADRERQLQIVMAMRV